MTVPSAVPPTSPDQALRHAARLFHEIVSALAAENLLSKCRNEIFAAKLREVIAAKARENLRSRDQIYRIAADGFELCVRSLAEAGTSDVTIHECGEQALGEQPWSSGDGDD